MSALWALVRRPITPAIRFRYGLPLTVLAVSSALGIWGLWLRDQILGHEWLRHSTAVFHVWPWPFRLAFIANVPACLAGALLCSSVSDAVPEAAGAAFDGAVTLIFVFVLWYWVAMRLDRVSTHDGTPATSVRKRYCILALFAVLCVVGALAPLGYVGFFPYGLILWFIMIVRLSGKPQGRQPNRG